MKCRKNWIFFVLVCMSIFGFCGCNRNSIPDENNTVEYFKIVMEEEGFAIRNETNRKNEKTDNTKTSGYIEIDGYIIPVKDTHIDYSIDTEMKEVEQVRVFYFFSDYENDKYAEEAFNSFIRREEKDKDLKCKREGNTFTTTGSGSVGNDIRVYSVTVLNESVQVRGTAVYSERNDYEEGLKTVDRIMRKFMTAEDRENDNGSLWIIISVISAVILVGAGITVGVVISRKKKQSVVKPNDLPENGTQMAPMSNTGLSKALVEPVDQPPIDAQLQNEQQRINLLNQYKQLLESGVISEEEFQAKKNEILGLNH